MLGISACTVCGTPSHQNNFIFPYLCHNFVSSDVRPPAPCYEITETWSKDVEILLRTLCADWDTACFFFFCVCVCVCRATLQFIAQKIQGSLTISRSLTLTLPLFSLALQVLFRLPERTLSCMLDDFASVGIWLGSGSGLFPALHVYSV